MHLWVGAPEDSMQECGTASVGDCLGVGQSPSVGVGALSVQAPEKGSVGSPAGRCFCAWLAQGARVREDVGVRVQLRSGR